MNAADLPELPIHILRQLTKPDAASLDGLYARCADFVQLAEGRAPAKGDGLTLRRSRPPRVPHSDKAVFGIWDGAVIRRH